MSEKPARGRLGVDVGGTFTDLLLVDQASGAMRIAKVPSTPADQSDGFMAGLAALGDAADGFETVVHGTTVGTNAVLERKGVRCALITTQGFRDTLELGRRTRPNPWGMFGSFEPIVPRERRFEVTERIDASGAVVTALDEEEVRAAVQAARAEAPKRSSSTSSTPTSIPTTSAAPATSPAKCGLKSRSRWAPTSCARCASSSAAAPPRSTATSSPS